MEVKKEILSGSGGIAEFNVRAFLKAVAKDAGWRRRPCRQLFCRSDRQHKVRHRVDALFARKPSGKGDARNVRP